MSLQYILKDLVPCNFNSQRVEDLLNYRTKDVFGYGQNSMTLKELGEKWGVGAERVRQIQNKLVRRMRYTIKGSVVKTEIITVDMRNSENFKLQKFFDSDALTCRTSNVLKNQKFTNMRDILVTSPSKFLRFPNFGKKSFRELQDFVLEQGFGPDVVGQVAFWEN